MQRIRMRLATGLIALVSASAGAQTPGPAAAPNDAPEPRRIPFPTTVPAPVPQQPSTLVPIAPAMENKPVEKVWEPVFDPALDVGAAIEAAKTSAAIEHRRVLIVWGMNTGDAGWMSARLKLAFAAPITSALLREEFDAVWALGGEGARAETNAALAKSLRADLGKGLPALTIIDPRGRPVANSPGKAFENGSAWDPDYVPMMLREWLLMQRTEQRDTQIVIEDALAKAKEEGKPVFLRFTLREDPWSDRLDAWARRPEVAPILARWFVVEKIDAARSVGGYEAFIQRATTDGTTPWFEFLSSADGKTLATSIPANGKPTDNIGFPTDDGELAAFAAMLRTANPKIEGAEIDRLLETLRAERKPELPASR